MDTTDPNISFSEDGGCTHCRLAERRIAKFRRNADAALHAGLESIRSSRTDSEYDCIIGVSGGVDSSSVMLFAAEQELRPLIVHVDAGWNTAAAVNNVERLCRSFDFDLETIVIDWEQLRGLQVAFLRSGVPNQDIPQDHVLFGALYRTARAMNIRTVIEGRNWQTESILPPSWGHSARDSVHIADVARRFGNPPIDRLPIMSQWEQQVALPLDFGLSVFSPLEYLDYDKEAAKKRLIDEYGWVDYGGKHHESRWTRFFQAFYLPNRFGYDKRKAHLSSLIVSGQMTRDQALAELEKPLYEPAELAEDKDYVIRKLGLTGAEFEELLNAPLRKHSDYATNARQVQAFRRYVRLRRWLTRMTGFRRAVIRRASREVARITGRR
jgi:N-acetyl sugar amidotransferase